MPKFSSCVQPDTASIASQALYAFRRGDAADCRNALAAAERLAFQLTAVDEGEAERMEALHGALQALSGPREERIQAGVYLLEHLAGRSAAAAAGS